MEGVGVIIVVVEGVIILVVAVLIVLTLCGFGIFSTASKDKVEQKNLTNDDKVIIDLEKFSLEYFKSGNRLTKYVGYQKTVIIPKEIEEIGILSFHNCLSIEELLFEKNSLVSVIRQSAFEGCKNLKIVEFPRSLKVIEFCAFFKCENLKKITIPESVQKIEGAAFEGCIKLENVSISHSVNDIDIGVFAGCSNIKSLIVDKRNLNYTSSNNCIIEKESRTLIYGCQNSVIPNDGSVRKIGHAAFLGQTNLKSILIPNSVKEIDKQAFDGCSSLKKITIPNSVTRIYDYAFKNCTFLNTVFIPDSVKEIGEKVFCNCPKLIIKTTKGSRAQKYAQKNGIKIEIVNNIPPNNNEADTILDNFNPKNNSNYGYTKDNPIMLSSIMEEYLYLSNLSVKDKNKTIIGQDRIGSVNSDSGILDVWEIKILNKSSCFLKIQKIQIYINPYAKKTYPLMCPKDFKLNN